MRIVDFKNINPGDSTIGFIVNTTGSYWTVKEVNINVTDGSNENLFTILQNVTSFAFTFNNVTYATDVITSNQNVNFLTTI